jgi:catechol 2,3-dioxygenase-like lactoylglutathione lyase family enzyme
MNVRIHHVAMRTHDLGRLERFYVSFVGLPVLRRDDARGSVWLDASGLVVMLERAADGEATVSAGTNDLVSFGVDDLAAWRDRLGEAGVAIEAQTGHTLYFRDPDGRRVGVSTYRFG